MATSNSIYDFIRSVGLHRRQTGADPLAEIIPSQCFVSNDNKFMLLAMYIGNKELAAEMISDYAAGIDRINHQGMLNIEYSLMDEICGIGDKEWAQRLEDFLPYEKRTAEIFSVIESPCRLHGVRGNGFNVSLATCDGYFVSFTELAAPGEVKDEDVEYLLSGKAVSELMAVEH